MIITLPPQIYIAQVYNCDTYGGSAYNYCPTTTTTTPSTSSSTNTTTTPAPGTTALDEPQTSTDAPSTPSKPSASTDQPESAVDTAAGLSWGIIIPVALGLAIVGALIIMFIKKRGRDNNTPLPPPTMPSGPSNPFSTGL